MGGTGCFCGDSFGSQGKAPDAYCNVTCTGNPKEICGGPNLNSVWAVEKSSGPPVPPKNYQGELSEAGAGCACADASLCKPLSTKPAREVFAFFDKNKTWPSLDFDTMTTACSFVHGPPDPALVCHAHSKGVRVVAVAAFDVTQITNATFRTAWVAQQLEVVRTNSLDGLNLDIEQYKGSPAPLTALVTELSAALKAWHPGSQLSFDLSIMPSGQAKYYDHKSLAAVLDFIVLTPINMAQNRC